MAAAAAQGGFVPSKNIAHVGITTNKLRWETYVLQECVIHGNHHNVDARWATVRRGCKFFCFPIQARQDDNRYLEKMCDEKARTLTDATVTGYSACLGKVDAIKRDSGCTTQIYL